MIRSRDVFDEESRFFCSKCGYDVAHKFKKECINCGHIFISDFERQKKYFKVLSYQNIYIGYQEQQYSLIELRSHTLGKIKILVESDSQIARRSLYHIRNNFNEFIETGLGYPNLIDIENSFVIDTLDIMGNIETIYFEKNVDRKIFPYKYY